jgi:phospholipid/cholesterol/gamma-HCH transport system substrate-binding protein
MSATRSRARTPARRRRRLHPLAVAALVIGAAVAITYYAFNRGVPFVHHYTLSALVTNSVNVRGGDPVRVGGIDVGQVVAVTPSGRDTRIEMTLQPAALPVHQNATIRIRDRLFLEGSYYLELDPGTASAPRVHDGGTLPVGQTSSPVQFFQLLSTFDSPTRSSFTGTINAFERGLGSPPGQSLQGSGAAGLKATAAQLQPLLGDTAIVTRAFQGTNQGDVGQLLSSSSRLAGTLADSSGQLADFVRGLGTTTAALTSADGALAHSVSGLDQTLRAAPASLRAVDAALDPVATLAHTLAPSLQVAPPELDRLTSTTQQLAIALSPARRGPLVTSLRATFQELPAILTQLARAFPIGKQITDCLQTHLVPVLNEQVPDGSLSTGRPVWQDFDHFLGGVAGASASFDANGPYTRFLAGAGTNTLSGTFGGRQLVASAPPGGTGLQGARPQWVGTLTPAAFRPDVPCTSQKLPSLASATAAPDLLPAGGGGP